MDREKVGLFALEAGFSLSTMHGQDTHKLMPISDVSTLERFATLVWNEAMDAAARECREETTHPELLDIEKYRAGFLMEKILLLKKGV